MTLEVERLDRSWDGRAADLLAECFRDDPAIGVLAGTDRRQKGVFRLIVNVHRDLGQPLLGITDDDRLLAVALILEPDARMSRLLTIRCLLRMLLLVGPTAVRRHQRISRSLAPLPDVGPRHTVQMVAVAPSWQGQGLASRLMQSAFALAVADTCSRGVALETVSSANIPLYQHLGYRLVITRAAAEYDSHFLVRDIDPSDRAY